MIQHYGEAPDWVKNPPEVEPYPLTKEEALYQENMDWERVATFVSTDKVMENLQKQKYVSDTTFKVIYVERYPGSWFLHRFNLNWKKDMVVLYTDKGWFIDTTVREHGGTEWIEGKTYNNGRVTMTRGNKLPFWLQKSI